MALANKYKTTYCDVYGDECIAYILQEGYVGSVTELDAQTTPFTISYDSGSDFKFEPIRASKASLNLVLGNGTDLDEFWTQNEREYQIAHYIDGVLDWIGWVIPNGFSYQLTGGLYYAELEATDGLETLDASPFWNDATEKPYGIDDISAYHTAEQFQCILILTEALKKIGLGLDVWVGVDVYEQTMTKNVDLRTGCPLPQAEVNVRTYIGDSDRDDIPYWRDKDEVFNTLEVLENLCYMFGAKVYQSQGVWRFKRVNTDIDYGTGATQRYWYKFNEDAVYILGRENINDLINIPCLDGNTAMIEDEHYLSMDEIYKRFRVNYKYTYARRGDSNVNLLDNGTFEGTWTATTAESAPNGWERFREPGKWRPKISQVTILVGEQDEVEFNTNGIEFGTADSFSNTDPYGSIWAGLRNSQRPGLNAGDELFFSFYAKFRPRVGYKTHAFMLQFKFITNENPPVFYFGSAPTNAGGDPKARTKVQWYQSDSNDRLFYGASPQTTDTKTYQEFYQNTRDLDDVQWMHWDLELMSLPGTGNLTVTMHGLGKYGGESSDNFPAFKTMATRDGVAERNNTYMVVRPWSASTVRPIITGVSLQIVPNETDRDKLAKYVYDNPDQSYTLQKKPIEVLHGDTSQEYTISQIIIPSKTNETSPSLWDVVDDSFGLSSLGLLQAKSIMQLYSKPNKILEGVIQHQDAQIDKAYTFDAIGTERFILQRGTFNRKTGYVENGVWIEISDETIVESGGSENNLVLDEIWWAVSPAYYENGGIRCELSGGVNTGNIEQLEIQANPNVTTFGDLRWTATGIADTTLCPIGGVADYYIGTDDGAGTVITGNLVEALPQSGAPSDSIYRFNFRNTGEVSGTPTLKYIYFVHLATIGTVSEVSAPFQPDITEDFTYQTNITIGGQTYKVLRQDYGTAEFELTIGFKF